MLPHNARLRTAGRGSARAAARNRVRSSAVRYFRPRAPTRLKTGSVISLASLELLRRTGRTAGMDLGKALQQHGITLDPSDLLRGERCVRTAVEVYPHVIHVCLFGLTERLPYKAKTGRSVSFRRAILCEYQDHLRSILRRYASGVIRNPELQLALSHETVMAAKGVVLKRFEDKLDAVTCALAAWMIWHDPSRWEKLGDLNGYIVAPLGEN